MIGPTALVACASLAAAAIALTTPAIAQSGGKAKQKTVSAAVTNPKPAVDGKPVQVMVELTAPAAGVAYAQALADARAALPRVPLATAAGQPRVQISDAAASRRQVAGSAD